MRFSYLYCIVYLKLLWCMCRGRNDIYRVSNPKKQEYILCVLFNLRFVIKPICHWHISKNWMVSDTTINITTLHYTIFLHIWDILSYLKTNFRFKSIRYPAISKMLVSTSSAFPLFFIWTNQFYCSILFQPIREDEIENNSKHQDKM